MAEQIKEIVWIRHAKSVTNTKNIFQAGDQFEVDPLDERGEWESNQLEKRFKKERFEPEIIISPSYLRGTQTARKIAQATRALVVVPLQTEQRRAWIISPIVMKNELSLSVMVA